MGPGTYIPRIEEEVLKEVRATVIKPNTALVVKAKKRLNDSEGKERRPGERWLIRKNGAYLPHEHEEVLEVRKGYVLTNKKCI
jgi:major vault protein